VKVLVKVSQEQTMVARLKLFEGKVIETELEKGIACEN